MLRKMYNVSYIEKKHNYIWLSINLQITIFFNEIEDME